MKIRTALVLVCSAFWLFPLSVQAGQKEVASMDDCKQCHGIPPGINGKQKNFNPGAHREHSRLGCDQCHVDGADRKHVDGIITLKPEIDYSYGTDVPWPAYGGGSCGGDTFTKYMPGCHASPNARCLWIPGGTCQK